MEFLNKLCQNCRKPMNGGVYRAIHVCPHCLFEHEGGKSKNKRRYTAASEEITARAQALEAVHAERVEEVQAEHVEEVQTQHVAEVAQPERPRPAAAAILTTKTASEHTIVESLSEVAAECVLNLKVTPEMISDGKFIGTKSEKVRAALEQGKKHVLAQLRQKAQEQGANLVTDVAVKNAVKTADAQNVKIVVRATGLAAVAELAAEATEA
jgi:Domain of unknown function (DUF74).